MSDKNEVRRSPVVPKEYAGKWIAWDRDRTKIIASAATLREARQKAIDTGEKHPLLDKVPQADVRFIGGSIA